MTQKEKIYLECQNKIDEMIQNAQTAMDSASESARNETKSSAGDKFETGRAMMQLEKEKNKVQLIKAMQLKQKLQSLNTKLDSNVIIKGSLVYTNKAIFYLGLGLGVIKIENQKIYTISMDAPLTKCMLNKTKGDCFAFNNIQYEIQNVE